MDNAGYVLLSLPFQDLGDSAVAGYPIQKIAGNLSQNDRERRAERLMVLDPETKGYTTYQYKTIGWVKSGEDTPTTDVVPLGASVFLDKIEQENSTMVIAGKVATDTQREVVLCQGFNLVSNPYPCAINISEISGTNLSASNRANRADKIMVLNPVTKSYTTYQLREDSGWTKEGESATTADTIAADAGFFYEKTEGDGSLLFKRTF